MNKSFFFEDEVFDWGRFKKTDPHIHIQNYPQAPPPLPHPETSALLRPTFTKTFPSPTHNLL